MSHDVGGDVPDPTALANAGGACLDGCTSAELALNVVAIGFAAKAGYAIRSIGLGRDEELASELVTSAASRLTRSFGNFAATDLRMAAEAADRNGLTRVGRALQKHSDRKASVFQGRSSGGAMSRNEQGLQVLDEILYDPNSRVEILDRVMNIWDTSGRGVRYAKDGTFIGFLEPVG